MKVCMVAPYFPPMFSGAGQQVHDFARLLAAGNAEVRITALDTGGMATNEQMNGMLVERITPRGSGRLKHPLLLFQLGWHLLRRRRHCQVVHLHGAYFPVFGVLPLLRLLGIKTTLTFWDPEGDMPEAIPRRGLGALQIRILSLAHCFVCVTSFVASSYRRAGLPPEKLRRIPAGIDTSERFRPADEAEKIRLRNVRGLPTGAKIAVYTGSIVPRKGVDVLVEAWGRVAIRFPDALLLLVGPTDVVEYPDQADFVQQLQSRISELGLESTILLPGRTDRVEEYLQLADLFVFASRQETFGISLIEGMACGLPSVVAAIEEVSTDIVDHERDGLLVEQQNPKAFAAAITRLLDDPELARKIGLQAVEKVREKFSIESISRQHYELYRELLA